MNFVIDYYGVDREWFLEGYDDRTRKEQPEDLLGGLSRREALIHVSEEKMKPEYGADFFGKLVANEITSVYTSTGRDMFVTSDGGFSEEIGAVIEAFGADSVVVFQLVREGHDFSADSRKYVSERIYDSIAVGKKNFISDKDFSPSKISDEVRTYRIFNNGSLQGFYEAVLDVVLKEMTNDTAGETRGR